MIHNSTINQNISKHFNPTKNSFKLLEIFASNKKKLFLSSEIPVEQQLLHKKWELIPTLTYMSCFD